MNNGSILINKGILTKYYFILISCLLIVKGYLVEIKEVDNAAIFIGQAINIITVIFLISAILFCFKNNYSIPKINFLLIIAFVIYWAVLDITNYISIGTSIQNNLYYIFLVLMILLLDLNEYYLDQLSKIIILYFLGMCLLSIIFFVLGKGVEIGYELGIFSRIVNMRMYGLTSHANSIGFIGAVLAIVGYSKFNKFYFVIGGLTMFLSQSKTPLYGVIICLVIGTFCKKDNKNTVQRIILIIITVVLAILGSNTIIYELQNFDFSFTGRTNIWTYGISRWSSSFKTVIFGYGGNLYSLAENENTVYGLNQAHNQFIQTLTSQGLIGLVSLIILLIILQKYSLKLWKKQHYESMFILILILIRCVAETPFTSLGINENGIEILFLIVVTLLNYKAFAYNNYNVKNNSEIA